MLLNKIAKENSREDCLLEYSDIILGQLRKKKNLSPELKMLARLVTYDYVKDIFNSTIKTQDIRVTMGDEFDSNNTLGYFSSYVFSTFTTKVENNFQFFKFFNKNSPETDEL